MTKVTLLPNDGQKVEVDASWLPILYGQQQQQLYLPIPDKDSLDEMIRYCNASLKMEKMQRAPRIARRDAYAKGAAAKARAVEEALNRDFLRDLDDSRLESYQQACAFLFIPRLFQVVYSERKRRMLKDGMTEAQIIHEIGPGLDGLGF